MFVPVNPPPISIIIMTKNEEARIAACLDGVKVFDDIWVVDSYSDDKTTDIAAEMGAQILDFKWNGQYPKKKQWCLEHVPVKHDYVFLVDADEIVTPALVEEMRGLDLLNNDLAAGYYVKGRYVFKDKPLRYGLSNNKLALIHRHKMVFPVIDDLGLSGIGEVEGHYQPVLKNKRDKIGALKSPLLHNAYDDAAGWERRHEGYAAWEKGMNERGAWPDDARLSKRIFQALPFPALIAFIHCYVLKLGFLDGVRGFQFAKSRWRYYRMIESSGLT